MLRKVVPEVLIFNISVKTCGVPVIDTSEMGNRSVRLGDKVIFNCKVKIKFGNTYFNVIQLWSPWICLKFDSSFCVLFTWIKLYHVLCFNTHCSRWTKQFKLSLKRWTSKHCSECSSYSQDSGSGFISQFHRIMIFSEQVANFWKLHKSQ